MFVYFLKIHVPCNLCIPSFHVQGFFNIFIPILHVYDLCIYGDMDGYDGKIGYVVKLFLKM